MVTVNRKNSNSYAFNLVVQILLGEVIKYYASWNAEGQVIGDYSIQLSASSDDPDFDPKYSLCQDVCEVQVLGDTPVMNEPVLSPLYTASGLDSREMYTFPWQNVELRCNISCPLGIENVTLWYSVDSDTLWNQLTMTPAGGDEWIGTVPGQPEGKLVRVEVEAFGLSGKSSRTGRYAYRVLDQQLLELRSTTVAGVTAVAIIVGVAGIFVWKKRKMTEAL